MPRPRPVDPAGARLPVPGPVAVMGVKLVEVSVPLVVILGAVVWVAWRYMGLRGWHIAVCLLFGFFLAATSAAPEIRRLVSVLVQSLSQH